MSTTNETRLKNIQKLITQMDEKTTENDKKLKNAIGHIKSIDNLSKDQQIKAFLRMYFDIHTSGMSKIKRDFMMQFTVFQLENDDPTKVYMNSILLETGDEGIYEISQMEESEQMEVEFKSWKGNYTTFTYKGVTEKPTDTNDKIYVINLFPETSVQAYKGSVYTRGGFTGWNWHTLPLL